ncbi:MAG TPA: efflux RND transporter periplasmic adaptor subunit [Blastocatellia bacterium]|nr:efflux RND transporter periplasmic adaptor subunit [Blastocatellia bacterium]
MNSKAGSAKKLSDQESELEPHLSPVARPQRGGLNKTAVIAGLLFLVTLLVIGIIPRLRRQSELSEVAREQEEGVPTVTVLTPHNSPATNELVLPATTQAIQETTISARTGGYIRRWYVGMGQKVNQGQLLAEIDTPEIDQELHQGIQEKAEAEQNVMQARSELSQAEAGLEQAEAALKQARTNLELARVNLERSKTLASHGVVSRQDTDDKQATFDARQADVEVAQANIRARRAAIKAQQSAIEARQSTSNARQANLQRLIERQSFQKVTAPYAGMITGRNIEVGALINSNGGTATSNGLYRLVRLDTIRVFVNIPQTFAAAIKPGLPTEVQVRELPQKSFAASLFGTSHSIDPTSRTMMAEIRINNPDQQLLPGMYAQVKFTIPSTNHALIIPAKVLMVNAAGPQVLVVSQDQGVRSQKVELGRDFGKEVEVVSGLTENDLMIVNPTDALRDGMKVKMVKGTW